MPVSLHPDLVYTSHEIDHSSGSHEKKVASSHRVTTFRKSTATGSIRRHLYENHLADWVHVCDGLKIPITAKLAVPGPLVEEYRLAQDPRYTKESGPEDLRREFSKEAFVEAILQWIISDDQVSDCF